jgi:putative flippase GtrA
MTLLRFFAASVFGLLFDIILAAVLHHVFGFSLIASAAGSLAAAAVLMYFVHEFWTFQTSSRTPSLTRMSATVFSGLAALGTRTAFLYTTSKLAGLDDDFAILQLMFASGASFVLNYFLVRRIIGGTSSVSS